MTTDSRVAETGSRGSRFPDNLLEWRNRLIANPRFQRWASRFPLTRAIARRKARDLFDIAAGFVYSKVLSACVSLDLFRKLQAGPQDINSLAASCQLSRDAMLRLLKAAESLGLLEDRGGNRFGLGDLGAAVLGNPGVAAMVGHNNCLYRDLEDPVALLRRETDTDLSRFWPYAVDAGGDARPYSELMSASQSLVAGDILDAVPMKHVRHLWDIAGGDGTFAAAALARNPGLRATVLDLEPVAALAAGRFEREGLAARANALSGDMFSAPLGHPPPTGASAPDLVSLVRVVHDHDDDRVEAMLGRLHTAMRPGAKLLLAEPMAESPGAEPMGHAYFGLYLWAMGSGRPRSADELNAMLQRAGFSNSREIRTYRPLMVRVLVAEA